MAKQKREIPAESVAAYQKIIDQFPEIEVKGAATAYTSVNGHMFSYLSREGVLGLRLEKGEQEAFVEKFQTEPFVQYGAVMRGYVTVPDSLLKDTKSAVKYFRLSYDYVSSLKPKLTKGKRE